MESELMHPVKILFVEDTLHDMELAIRELKKEKIDFISRIVENETDLINEIKNFIPDIVISDYSMPAFDGMRALKVINNIKPQLPVIIFTGSINEETAVKCMKAGASDYVLKEKIKRLPFAVKEILEKCKIIKEKTETEDALKESNLKFKEFAEQLTDVIFITDLQGIIQYISPSSIKIFGFEPNEMINEIFMKFVTESEMNLALENFNNILNTSIPVQNLELILKRKDNSTFNCEISCSLLIKNSKNSGIIGIIRDITSRKQSEELLKNSENKYRTLVEKMQEGLLVVDNDDVILFANKKLCELLNYSESELIGKTGYKTIINPYDIDRIKKKNKDRITGLSDKYEINFVKKDQTLILMLLNANPLYDAKGEVIGSMAICSDISERKKWETELMLAKEKAELSNKLKDAFIANISHEIRTPLNGILGMTTIIEESLKDYIESEHKRYFQTIQSSSKRLIRTIDMIINFSRLQIGEFTIKPCVIDLDTVIKSMLPEFTLIAEKKGLKFSYENNSGKINVSIDEYSISFAISNIIDNALKYTNKGNVTIKLEKEAEFVKLIVSDTGIGISDDYIQHVFTPYSQEETGYSRSFEGVGLGLPLAKRLIELNGAAISVKSEKDKGTEFILSFENKLSFNEINNKNQLGNLESSEILKKKHKILIVEDDYSSQELLDIILKKNHEISFAMSAEDALEIIKNDTFDMILMDISLKGGLNGLQLTKILKNNPLYNKIPIIAVTAHAFENDRIASLEAGCNDYISKPIRKNDLINIVNKNLST